MNDIFMKMSASGHVTKGKCHKFLSPPFIIVTFLYITCHHQIVLEDILPCLSHILIILQSFADTVLTSTGSAGAVVLGRCAVSVTPLTGAPDGGRVA